MIAYNVEPIARYVWKMLEQPSPGRTGQGNKSTFGPSQFSRQEVKMMRIRGDRSLGLPHRLPPCPDGGLDLGGGRMSERSDLSRAGNWRVAGETVGFVIGRGNDGGIARNFTDVDAVASRVKQGPVSNKLGRRGMSIAIWALE